MDRIFEPFFSTKAAGHGSGMGMAMVYGFVQQSEGAIAVQSTVGSGTTVSLYFPLLHAEEPAVSLSSGQSRPDAAVPTEGRRGLALLVEDDPGVRQLLRRELLDIGFSVMEAENGEEAIGLIDHIQGIKLLLSDVVMPGRIDGLAVVEHARARGEIGKIMLMSAFVPSGARPADLPFLQKPFSRTDLLLALSELTP